ncbi:MAG: hypothetical protein PUE85_00050 [Firmicutes bacterium]|nr:hypothetical protein [Bacillota bacterium]
MRSLVKIISVLLMFSMLISIVSCAKSEKDAETTPQQTEEPDDKYDPFEHLPDTTFNDRSFRIAGSYGRNYTIKETAAKEILSAAEYKRNLAISERFKVKFQNVDASVDVFVKNTLADQHYTEVGCAMVWVYGPALMGGALRDIRSIDHISFDADWWYPEINESQTFFGKTLAIIGDMDASLIQYMAVVFLNMELIKDYGLTSDMIYDVVKDGGWSLDYISEIIKPMYKDYDQDGLRSAGDFYGFSCTHNMSLAPWPVAGGSRVSYKNSDDELEVVLGSDRNQAILDKLKDIFTTNSGSFFFNDETGMPGGSIFFDQRLVFYPSYMAEAFGSMREVKFSYGMAPYPKYDNEQDSYYTLIQDGVVETYLPKTLPESDEDFVGIILEACAKYTREFVIPVYYDDALKNRYSEDPATAEMVDLINSVSRFDMSIIFGTDPGLYDAFEQALKEGTTLVRKQAVVGKQMERKMKKIYPLYE